jgi:hypothetical protein
MNESDDGFTTNGVVEMVTLHVRIPCVGCGRKLETSETLGGDAVRTGNTTQTARYWLEDMRKRMVGTAGVREWKLRTEGYLCAHCIAAEVDKLGDSVTPRRTEATRPLCGECQHPPHYGPCLVSVDPAGLTAATRDKVCPCGIVAAPEPHDEVAAEIAEKAEDDECWGYADRADPEEWRGASRTREEAIAEGRGYFGSDAAFWIASGTRATSAHYLPSWREFEENLNQSVSDNSSCPDGVDDPFEFREGAEEAFTSMLEDWAEKYMAEANWWEMDGKPERVEPLAIVHKYRGNTTGFLCGFAPVHDTGTTSADRKDTTCPACLRLWIESA